MFPRVLSALALLPFLASAAGAHEFWIEPSTFRREKAGPVTFSLRVGEHFTGAVVPREAAHIERFFVAGPRGERELVGREGDDPAGFTRLEEDGLHVVAYRSGRRSISLEAKKFETYLAEDGLDDVLAWRKAHGESATEGREVYSRAVKSFVRVGPEPTPAAPSTGFDRRFGYPFELVPESDPLLVRAGESLRVLALVDGKPAANVLVGALQHGDANEACSRRTDGEGRVELRLDRPGTWLVHAVHMRRAPADTRADWESTWSSLTFDVRPQPVPAVPIAAPPPPPEVPDIEPRPSPTPSSAR
jgi:uncharacterized GH25 family protein